MIVFILCILYRLFPMFMCSLYFALWAVIRKNIVRQQSILEHILIEAIFVLHMACCKSLQNGNYLYNHSVFLFLLEKGRLVGVHFFQIQHRNPSTWLLSFCDAPCHFNSSFLICRTCSIPVLAVVWQHPNK